MFRWKPTGQPSHRFSSFPPTHRQYYRLRPQHKRGAFPGLLPALILTLNTEDVIPSYVRHRR